MIVQSPKLIRYITLLLNENILTAHFKTFHSNTNLCLIPKKTFAKIQNRRKFIREGRDEKCSKMDVDSVDER